MQPSVYGETIARKLFTDNEMEKAMLFPIRAGARPPLSPTRVELFRDAVIARYGADNEDALSTAVSAVNQLGNDLKRGRRRRRDSI